MKNMSIKINEKLKIGGGGFVIISGPCTIESEIQMLSISKSVKKLGVDILRGGAFKPRTSPHDFQGLRDEGLKIITKVKEIVKLPFISEVVSIKDIEKVSLVADILQVGERNMQNFELLKHLGKTKKPILIKRGKANTINELLMSAEYVKVSGNNKIILCERGIRTFENETRFTLDLSMVPIVKTKSPYPIIVDPSHALGNSELVSALSKAALVVGADGLMVECHNNPKKAMCDGEQSITPSELKALIRDLNKIRKVL